MQRRWTSRVILGVVLLVLTEGAVLAGDDPYGRLLKNLEQNYHGKRTPVPFLGLANFVLKFWHPAGVKSVKLAVFQDLSQVADGGDPSFDTALKAAAGSDWQPVVRVYSRVDHQWVYVYLLEEGKDVKILVASHGQREGVIAQVKFNPDKLAEFIQHPQIFGVQLARDIKRGPDGNGPAARPQADPGACEVP